MAELEYSGINLPYSLDAEQSVLGAVLISGKENMPKVSARLRSEHFHVKMHSDIFSVFSRMFALGETIDVVTVLENCLKNNIFGSAEEGRSYLFRLMESVPSISSIEKYIDIVIEKYTRRQLISVAGDILEHAGGVEESTQSLLDLAESKIYDIREENQIKGLVKIEGVIYEILNELSIISADPDKAGKSGLHSGFPSLDKYIYGLNKSDLIIIAARPGMGKTSFAMNIATNSSKYHRDKAICIFSLEMSKEQIVERMLSSESMVPSSTIKTGRFSGKQWRSLADVSSMLSKLNIYIDDSSNITVNEMKAKLRRVNNLGLVIIDYLQLMSSGRRDLNRVGEISEITRNLKIMAKELNVPVITLSQLSRSAEKKDDKRPMLSDLRDSGSIEQDADIVLFLYRGDYYNKNNDNNGNEIDHRACECIIAKNRHGETKEINMMWDGQYTRFTDVEYIHAEQ